MKITVDTSILIRSVVRDDKNQAEAADKALKEASLIAVPLHCLCEFVRVLRRVYKFDATSIAAAIRVLIATEKVVTNHPAIEIGLAVLEAGGDFADGVIAYEGNWLGGNTFVSFDREAMALLARQRQSTCLLPGNTE